MKQHLNYLFNQSDKDFTGKHRLYSTDKNLALWISRGLGFLRNKRRDKDNIEHR